MPGAVDVRQVTADQVRPLRATVLRPGRPFDETRFAGDDAPAAIHLAALTGNDIVGIATFTPQPCAVDGREGDWQLRGMATAPALQGRGVGRAVLAEGLRLVRERGGRRVWCNGRTSAVPFYERLGFRAVGDEFERPGTGPHFVLICDLAAAAAPVGGGIY